MGDSQTDKTPHPKPVIGLLGAPGSGKSAVAQHFASLGCAVIDADRLAHAALDRPQVAEQLRQWWGDAVVDGQGKIDRKAVGDVVFQDENELRRLEALIHPIVHEQRQRQRDAAFAAPRVKAVIEDCPLLLETGLQDQCDALVFIDCPRPIRLSRLAASRGWDESELKKREGRQLPLDIKRQTADYVISNGEATAQSLEQAERVLQKVRSSLRDPGTH